MISQRQHFILSLALQKQAIQTSFVLEHLSEKVTRQTIIRDFDELTEQGILSRCGQGRGVHYVLEPLAFRDVQFDFDPYFSNEQDRRLVYSHDHIWSTMFALKGRVFTESEHDILKQQTQIYRENVQGLDPVIYQKELERLTIDLAWKSSQIEGNTYTLLDTEILIKEQREAVGHARHEADMILNHKETLLGLMDQRAKFLKMNLSLIFQVHQSVTQNLSIHSGVRVSPVGVTGTNFRPKDNEHQIREDLEQLLTLIDGENVFEQSFVLLIMMSYIQAFQDGNKRTARMLSDAVLLAHGACPLSYRSVDVKDYKQALILFYETGSLAHFKRIFMQQYVFAVGDYFRG